MAEPQALRRESKREAAWPRPVDSRRAGCPKPEEEAKRPASFFDCSRGCFDHSRDCFDPWRDGFFHSRELTGSI